MTGHIINVSSLPMPLTEQEAFEAARRFVLRMQGTLAYPVAETSFQHRHVQGSRPPRVVADSAAIGGGFWEFDFLYKTPGKLVDPSGVRIFVDSFTGAAALFSPR